MAIVSQTVTQQITNLTEIEGDVDNSSIWKVLDQKGHDYKTLF